MVSHWSGLVPFLDPALARLPHTFLLLPDVFLPPRYSMSPTISSTPSPSFHPLPSTPGAVVSHRSGETEDTFIADLAVGTACGQIKAGVPGDQPAVFGAAGGLTQGLEG